jgi:two-component system sensor kinase FixL
MITAALVACPADLVRELRARMGDRCELIEANEPPPAGIVVVGPAAQQPIGVVQSVFRRHPDAIVLVAVNEARLAAVTEALRYAPFVGVSTRVVPAEVEVLAAAIDDAATRAEAARVHEARLEAAAQVLASSVPVGRNGDVDRLVERLRARESFLAALVESTDVAIVGLDLDGVVNTWNPAAEALYAHPAGEMIGNSIARVVPEERHSELEANLAAVRSGAIITEFETTRLTGDGEAIEVSLTISPMRDREGRVRWASEVGHDISRRQKERRALEQAERRKAAVIDTAIDAIITADRQGRIVEFNPAAERLFGWAAAEVVGRELAETVVPARHRQAHRDGLARYLRTGESRILGTQIEVTGVRADGSEFPLELGITAVDLGGAPLFTAHVRDITARERAKEDLTRSNEALRTYNRELEESERRIREATEEAREAARRADEILDQASDALVAVDPDGRIVLFNQAAQQMFGYSFDEVKDRPVETLVPAAFTRRHPGLVRAFVRSEDARRLMAPDRDRLMARRKNGSEFPAAITVGPIDLGTGTRMGMALIRDQTRVVEAEDATAAASATLERRNLELQQFLFIASHDLKEPLRKVESFGSELSEALPDLEDWPALCLDRMLDATRRMARLLAALEEYTRVVTRPTTVAACDLASIVADILVDLSLRIDETGADVTVADLPVVTGDEVHLRHIFQNLIGNALKFTRPGAAPVVRIYPRTTDFGVLEVVVEDEGIGIEPEYTERIFEPFRRLHGPDRYEGTGMGLAIARRVAQLSGDSIRVEQGGGGVGTRMVVGLGARPSQ